MRSDNRNQIVASLVDGPQTIPEIVQRTGLSYSTVKRALESEILDAEPVDSTWPRKWKLSTDVSAETPTVGPALDGRVAVGIQHFDDLVSKWNSQAAKFGVSIGELAVSPTDDPRELAKRFATAASTMANLAYSIGAVATKPDWFELAGGKLESE